MMMGYFPFVSEIMAQSLERTMEILNGIQSGSATDAAGLTISSAIWTAGALGMAVLIMACSVIGTICMLKLVKRFLESEGNKQ